MAYILMLTGSFMVFIVALIGAQSCCTKTRRKWMWLWVVCAVVSGLYIGDVLYQAFTPKAEEEVLRPFQNSTPM